MGEIHRERFLGIEVRIDFHCKDCNSWDKLPNRRIKVEEVSTLYTILTMNR
jgi:hypothetical protein